MKINQNKLNKILKYYALTTMIVMLVFPIVVSVLIYIQRRDALVMEMERDTRSVVMSINERSTETMRLAQILTSTNGWEEELTRYFNESYSSHWTYYLLNRAKGEFLPHEISRQYRNNQYLDSVQIIYQDNLSVYRSDLTSTMGRKVEKLELPKGINTVEELRSPLTFQPIGQLYMSYSFDLIENEIQTNQYGDMFAYDPLLSQFIGTDSTEFDEKVRYSSDEVNVLINNLKRSNFVSERLSNSGHRIFYITPKMHLISQLFLMIVGIFLFCGVTAGALSIMIFRQLQRYANQVNDILVTTSRIEKGQVYFRINENNKEAELEQITKAINSMLDGQQASIREVFQLQIKHSEAVLKALQAQINPHFLYNTLEFIRMSAYLEGAESLADFVYDFSSLLRNNITNEKEASIGQEIYFIQKYIKLYQARYPNKLEVKYKIDEQAENIIVPKFTLQPLVENYLVHGVDFSLDNNKLEIEIALRERILVILITDNGRGMTDEQLLNNNLLLENIMKDPIKFSQEHTRLGIAIVAQRLAQTFGQNVKMKYEKNYEGGVKVCIQIPLKDIEY